jgi:hypothetical protein
MHIGQSLHDVDAKKRLETLDVQWAGWRNNPDGHILVALQLPGDASLRGADINDWALRTILDIRQNTGRFVVVRNHPLSSQRAFADHEELARKLLLAGVQNIRFSDGAEVPWSDDLQNAYCTVTYTSGLAIDSVVAGIPTVAYDPGNFAWSISSHSAGEINEVKMVSNDKVSAWLKKLAGCQWSQSGNARWYSLATSVACDRKYTMKAISYIATLPVKFLNSQHSTSEKFLTLRKYAEGVSAARDVGVVSTSMQYEPADVAVMLGWVHENGKQSTSSAV